MASKKNFVSGAIGVVLLILALISGVFAFNIFNKNKQIRVQMSELREFQEASQGSNLTEEEVNQLIEDVSKLISLPDDERPTIATVANPDALKDQLFFANASVGDRVFIYTESRKAILYNPNTNKIVEVAPINLGEGDVPEDLQEDDSGVFEEIPAVEDEDDTDSSESDNSNESEDGGEDSEEVTE
ncbi:MAG: hypothetical protein COU27_03515 [Candidatus Levybacteria bacterium CG10_big_fil_rev_8_21_14_0_10_36_7]|nr:MAG: hypothetical protein COU27_03515 [Candidatus Levybacteria bacterium CG10_big_fil_rev_8_21_14_0_10_36_7]